MAIKDRMSFQPGPAVLFLKALASLHNGQTTGLQGSCNGGAGQTLRQQPTGKCVHAERSAGDWFS